MSTWAGKTLDKVHIDSLLARGGMAEVYLGTHTTLQREVAVKILRNHYEDDPTSLERFQREARVVAKLRHPNIVQVFDFDTVDDQPYIVMEYIPGPSLSKYLKALHGNTGRLEFPFVSRLLTGVASALQYAHASGVIHRDVKPGNILLISRSSQIIPGEPLPVDFEPVLTDFGLVRFLSAGQETTIGHIAGTPAYMSPEQARGEQTDGRTDIYSLGIVLYELLAGHVPFDGETTMSILLKQVSEPPAAIPGLSAPLQNVLERALAKNTADRFQTPNEFATAFNAAMEDGSDPITFLLINPVTDPSDSDLPARKTGSRSKLRNRWVRAALAGILTIALGASLLLSGVSSFGNKAATESPTIETVTSISLVSSPLGQTGVLRFQDGTAVMDRAILTALAMPAPPAGSQYEVWLVGGEKSQSLGILSLDGNGKGLLEFNDRRRQNLLGVYDRIEVRITPETNSSVEVIERVAYSSSLPKDGLSYVRRLLVSSSMTPDRVGLIQGLLADTKLIDQNAVEMLNAYENGDEVRTRARAEFIMNLLVGSQSQEYKDWNGDGQIDPDEVYGFLLNGNNLGYIQAVYSHADYAVNSPGASQNMILHGGHVKVCAENLAQWAPQLHDRVFTILTSASLEEMDRPVRDSVILAHQMLNGIDLEDNGEIEPISGECGVLTIHEYAYRMADMPLLPVRLTDTPTAVTETSTATPTATPTIIIVQPTSSTSGGSSGNPSDPQPTKKPKNTPKPENTRKPPPDKKP